MEKISTWGIILLLTPIGILLLSVLWDKLIDYISKPNTKYAFTKRIQTTTTKRKVLCKKYPPRATFFSKVNGQERQMNGPYEEKWLTAVEKWNWKMRRKNE